MVTLITMENLWKSFPGCECIKRILINCGFDSEFAIKCINENNLDALKGCVDKNFIKTLNCAHLNFYMAQEKFELLPGHRALTLEWSKRMNQTSNQINDERIDIRHPAFSPILREIISTALKNYSKTPHARRFSDFIMNFSIYIYIMAGRACYDILSANIPLPKTGTIRKLGFVRFSRFFLFFIQIFPEIF